MTLRENINKAPFFQLNAQKFIPKQLLLSIYLPMAKYLVEMGSNHIPQLL